MPVDDTARYQQAGEMLRHYLSWRERLFAGYLLVIAGLAVAVKNFNEPVFFRSAMALLGLVLTVVFWLLERRNRALFVACVGAGAALEESGTGPMTALNNKDGETYTPTHTAILGWFFALAILSHAAIAVYYWPSQAG